MTAQQSGSARFLKALAVEEYDTLLAGITVKGPDPEAVLVPEASGRVASQDVTSPIDVPSFPKSRVDGYALKAESTFTASDESPVPLYLAGSIEMGEVPSFSLDSINDCIYVPTGGIIPDGADAVVKVEFTTERKSSSKGKTTIHVAKAVVPGQGTLGRGSDMKQGETIVKTNTVLSTATIGSLAAAGLTTVHVHRKPRVGLFSTGNELLEPGLPFGPGKIYDVNRIILKTLFNQNGCITADYGIVQDDFEQLHSVFEKVLQDNDMLVCSGGTSKGRGDFMPRIMERDPGLSVYVHGIRIKPGKPFIFGMISNKPVFILPGNPTSAMLVCMRLVLPHVRRWNRLPVTKIHVEKAVLQSRVYSELGRKAMIAVSLKLDHEGTTVAVPTTKGSETITTLLNAQGYFEIPENVEIVEKGTTVDVKLFPMNY